MKTLVYTQPNEVAIEERPYPEVAEEEVVVKIAAAGICGSDMHAYHGHDPRRKPGLVLGHEFSGTIEESRSLRFRKGVRVTGNPLITCGYCKYCLQGRNNLCANRTMIGMSRPGAFAEYMSIPSSCLIRLPDTISFNLAALTEPAATALHAINISMRALARPLPECSVLLIGGGAIGMLSALLLQRYGVNTITVIEKNAGRANSIKQAVNCTVVAPADNCVEDNTYEYVMDCVGAAPTRKIAMKAVKPGGVVMHVGLQDWESEIDMRKLTLGEITLMGTYTYGSADMHAALDALTAGKFGSLNWIENRRLDEAALAFADLHHGKTAAAKILLHP